MHQKRTKNSPKLLHKKTKKRSKNAAKMRQKCINSALQIAQKML